MTPAPIAPEALGAELDRLEAAGAALRAMPTAERVAALGRVAAAWTGERSTWRRRAVPALVASTGYATAAVESALDELWTALAGREIAAVVAREMDDAITRAPERLAWHSFAGNVPGAGVFGIFGALVAGVPSLVKTARRETVLPVLVAESIAAEDARLGDAVTAVHWPGGSDAHERVVVERATIVLAYGRAETIERIAAMRPRRLLRFGPRLSAAVVCSEAATAATAGAAARQVALFDQQGCLSPQYVVVEEQDRKTTDAFVDALGAALERLAVELPRARLGLAEATDVWRHVERQRWREQEGADVRVVAGADGAYSVTCDRTGALPGTPLNRHVVVLPVASLGEAAATLRRLDGMVEAVGAAGPEARLVEIAETAAACGAARLCPLDRLQAPPFAWRQSGHERIAPFLVPTSGDPQTVAPA